MEPRRRVPLIVGGGPTGLASALFLMRAGVPVRLVETRARRSPHSKALAVNPRTLELLEESGVTARMLARGRPIRGIRLHQDGELVFDLAFEGLHPRYPFLLGLSQAASEELLEEAFVAAGGTVERGTRLLGCARTAAGVEARLERASGGAETVVVPWLVGADGAHSTVRSSLAIDFPGRTFESDWWLADVPLATDTPRDRACAHFFARGGFVIAIPVHGALAGPDAGASLWRLISDAPDPLALLPGAEPTGPAVWESSFRIAHRLAEHLALGPVVLAGDAAHVHSPVGARGMNLGIEDAWVLARLALRGELARYEELRRPVDRAVVRRVELFTRVARGRSPLARFARSRILPRLASIQALRERIFAVVAGLDHSVADL